MANETVAMRRVSSNFIINFENYIKMFKLRLLDLWSYFTTPISFVLCPIQHSALFVSGLLSDFFLMMHLIFSFMEVIRLFMSFAVGFSYTLLLKSSGIGSLPSSVIQGCVFIWSMVSRSSGFLMKSFFNRSSSYGAKVDG